MDIFLMNDETVVLPCENELFEYGGKWVRDDFKNTFEIK